MKCRRDNASLVAFYSFASGLALAHHAVSTAAGKKHTFADNVVIIFTTTTLDSQLMSLDSDRTTFQLELDDIGLLHCPDSIFQTINTNSHSSFYFEIQ